MLEAGMNRDERAGEKGCVPEVPVVQFIPIISRANNATARYAERVIDLWDNVYKDSVQHGINDDDASEEHAQVERKFSEAMQVHAIYTRDATKRLSSTYKTLEDFKVPIAKAVEEKKHLSLYTLNHIIECLSFLSPAELLEKVNEYSFPTKEEILAKYPLKPESEWGTFVS